MRDASLTPQPTWTWSDVRDEFGKRLDPETERIARKLPPGHDVDEVRHSRAVRTANRQQNRLAATFRQQ